MNFVTGLSISTKWKDTSYDLILVIINWLMKMVYYEQVKIIIDTPGPTKVILNIIVHHHNQPNLIASNQVLVSN